MTVQFRILGPLELVVDGDSVKLGGAKQQLVLAALLLEPNRVVSVDRLIEWVWSDDAPERASTLQVYVSNLRRVLTPMSAALGRQLIVTQRPGYSIEVEPNELDSLEFELLRRSGETSLRAGAPGDASQFLRSALALWRGEPLAGLPIEAVAQGEVSRLEVARATTTEQLGEAELLLGRHQEIVNELRGWVSEWPLNERLRGLLMTALYRCGWQAEALAAFREGRDLLVEQLGIDPSKELCELENRILGQDPTLDHTSPLPSARAGQMGATVIRSSVLGASAQVRVGGSTIPLDRAVTTIGRLPDRDVVLLDAGASRVHAEIRLTPDGYLLVDSGSANGTVVRGERVHEHLLAGGDVIRIGETEIEFHDGSDPIADQP